MEKYGLTLDHVIAQCVHFAWDDFAPDGTPPEDVVWTVSYQVSCYLAQHTVLGDAGVATETGLGYLRVSDRIEYTERLRLAEIAIEDLGGVRPRCGV